MAPAPPRHTLPPKSIPNRELLQRVSYTYQANVFLHSLGEQLAAGRQRHVTAAKRDRKRSVAENEDGQDVFGVGASGSRNDDLIEDGEGEEEEEEERPETPPPAKSAHDPRLDPFAHPRQAKPTADVSNRILLSIGRKRQGKVLQTAARASTAAYKQVLKHNMIKTDPGLKRSMCKSCDAILIPGLTCRVRVKPSASHIHKVVTTCLTCTQTRTIPSPPLLPPSAIPTTNAIDPVDPSGKQAGSSGEVNQFGREELVPCSVEEEGEMNGVVLDSVPSRSIPSGSEKTGDSHPTTLARPSPHPSSPAPTLPRSKLDGPNRANRRARAARPIPLWQREAGAPGPVDGVALAEAQAARRGNKWSKTKRSHKVDGEGRWKTKAKGREGKGGGAGGHSVWAGDRIVRNWGVGAEP